MGLDQFLNKKTYVKNWDHMEPAERHEIIITRNNKPTNIKPERIIFIEEEMICWRKANQIHKWFVDNVQEGEDDCRQYDVSYDQLKELLKTIKEVIKSPTKAKTLLPFQEGFFFGGNTYDSYYFQQLTETEEKLETILKELHEGDLYYSSSW